MMIWVTYQGSFRFTILLDLQSQALSKFVLDQLLIRQVVLTEVKFKVRIRGRVPNLLINPIHNSMEFLWDTVNGGVQPCSSLNYTRYKEINCKSRVNIFSPSRNKLQQYFIEKGYASSIFEAQSGMLMKTKLIYYFLPKLGLCLCTKGEVRSWKMCNFLPPELQPLWRK